MLAMCLLHHGPTYCTCPYDQGRFDSVCKFWLFMKGGFDSAYLCYIGNYSVLEANCAIIINLCDPVCLDLYIPVRVLSVFEL